VKQEVMMQDADNNLELVSALADGQLHDDEFARALALVNETEDARLTWHAYHVVGDVLRSGTAGRADRDAAFMQRLRRGLQQEQPFDVNSVAIDLVAANAMSTGARGLNDINDVAANESRYRWKLWAGLASLATVFLIGWQVLVDNDLRAAAQLAQVTPSKPEVVLPLQIAVSSEPQVMIRDPQLDALLAAHRQFGGTSALQMPTGFLRNATFEGAAR
jgi:sigma-E factor negative regulatory protein RseA